MKKLLLVVIFMATACHTSFAENYIDESFTDSTASEWTFINGQGEGPILTAANGIDQEGSGWLRLTQNTNSQSSFVYCTNVIDATYGLVFEFDFVVWGPQYLGDGFTLAIFDAAVTPDAGGYGGSLGYAQRYNIGGLNGGIVGFGFDTFGNFSLGTEDREGGLAKTPNAIAIRGSMGATRDEGYAFITNTATLNAFSTKDVSSRTNASIHSVRITIPTNKLVSIEWKVAGDTAYTKLIDEFQCSLTCPDDVRFGFTGGTGGAYANQEIRNLTVSSESEVPTSSGVDLRAYQAADGVYVEFAAYDVEEDGPIQLYLLGADGQPLWTGTTHVDACECSLCRFLVPDLEVNSTYSFKVRDEVGKIWSAPNVPVGKFAVEMTRMTLTGMTVSFNSLPDREYEIQWTENLGSLWQTVTNIASEGERTSVAVMHPIPQSTSGFFKIIAK